MFMCDQAYVAYGDHMTRMVKAIDPLLDADPLHPLSWIGPQKSLSRAWENRASLKVLLSAGELAKVVFATVRLFCK